MTRGQVNPNALTSTRMDNYKYITIPLWPFKIVVHISKVYAVMRYIVSNGRGNKCETVIATPTLMD